MFLSQCGNEVSQEQSFCNTHETAASKRRPKGILTIILSVALAVSVAVNIISLLGKGNPNKFEGKGFSSPEKAIAAYVEALREGDIEKMLSTFAIESYVERFDFEAYLRKNPSIMLSAIGMSLPDGGTYRPKLNIYSRLAAIFGEIRYGYFALIDVDPTLIKKVPIGDEMDEGIEALTKELSGNAFDQKRARIKTGDVLIGEDLDPNEEILEFMLDSYSSYLDVDDFCEVAIEIEFDENDFLLYMLTVEINGRWYNMTTYCPSGQRHANQNDTILIGGFLKQ